MLPGQTRPMSTAPGGPMNGQNQNGHHQLSNQPNSFNHGPNTHPSQWNNQSHQYPNQHSQQPISSSSQRDGQGGSLPPIHFKPAQGQSGPVAQTQSFARQARRLYVGNILHTANEMNVAEFFNAKMKELGLLVRNGEDGSMISISENPVVAVQVNHEKNYAFVEVSCLFTK